MASEGRLIGPVATTGGGMEAAAAAAATGSFFTTGALSSSGLDTTTILEEKIVYLQWQVNGKYSIKHNKLPKTFFSKTFA